MIRLISYRFSLALRWFIASLAAGLLLWTEASGQTFNDRVQRTDSLFEAGNIDSGMAVFSRVLRHGTDILDPRDTLLLPAFFGIM